ncbi:MAG: B12-binding domain-containing radical SAM protein [Acidobacteria bacterium]|nr:B12-binding domain-containing radical SAM protein [Acidobacteriota bacterium]
MRVFFIYPNLNAEEGFNHGIADLSGALKARGHETALLNLNETISPVPELAQIIDQIRQWRADLVAFSVMTQQYRYALFLGQEIKKAFPDLPLIIGGVHTMMCTEEVKADRFWDFIGVGECDVAFPDLVDLLERNDPFYWKVPNFCIRRTDGTYQHNPLGPYPSLDDLPSKDYEIFGVDWMLHRKNGWQSILTSRGCPYRCTYCFNHEVTDRYRQEGGFARKSYLRHYSIDRILGEIKQLIERHPSITTFIFDDDLFTLNEDYCREFTRAYTKADIQIPFVLNAHVQTFTEKIAHALAEAPCMIVKFGVESGSETLRKKVLERRMSNSEIIEAFELCHAYGLHTSAFLMFGLPNETRSMMEETIDLIARLRPGRMRWAIFFPFPGTESFNICRRANLIDWRKMQAMENYFCASCLKFDTETDLFIRKLQRTFHWWVNARSGLALSSVYQRMVDEIDKMDFDYWLSASENIFLRDRELSESFLAQVAPGDTFAATRLKHYSLRYTEVMAVDSDFVLGEKGDYKNYAVRRWKAFREKNPGGAEVTLDGEGGLEWRSIPGYSKIPNGDGKLHHESS